MCFYPPDIETYFVCNIFEQFVFRLALVANSSETAQFLS